MTVQMRDNVAMTLLSAQANGFWWTLLLYLLCFIIVHAIKLAAVGYRTIGKHLPPEPPKEPQKTPEPVYFLVERKKKRPKKDYSEPKQINFQ